MRDILLREADALWPLLEPKVRAVARAMSASGGAGAGGVGGQHDIGGAKHIGQLRDDQAPQFLKLDGTRALTGNLAVAAGVMIDGIDIGAHAANPDAHHARQHSVLSTGDHTIIGSQYQIVGLTAANTLGLLTPSFNPGAGPSILRTDGTGKLTLRTLEVTTDLFVNGALDLGVDTIYEDSTYLLVMGSKPVRFGQNIGNLNWTIFNTGGAQFGGNLDVLAGGDLTVAGSGAYAGLQVLLVDSSGGNVGINCAPDPQFALDVLGPARASYFVGPHAIQLKDVLLLSHFDGRGPAETNFTGELNGHMGQVGTALGGLIFRPGKFYGAAQIAEATTNLIVNPSFEVDTAGWAHNNQSGLSAFARSSAQSRYGLYSLLATNTATGADDYFSINVSGLAAGTAHTVSVWVNVAAFTAGAASNRGLFAYDLANVGTAQAAAITGATAGWVRLSVAVTTTAAAGAHTIQVRLYAPGGTTYWDAVQMEAKAYPTPYCDGSLGGYGSTGVRDGSGHTWAGTAHASTSTRAAALLTYPTAGNILPEKWTAMAWVNPATLAGGLQTILRCTGSGGSLIILRLDATGKPQAYGGTGGAVTAASAIPANAWSHVAATYDGATLRLYVNGVPAGSAAKNAVTGLGAFMYVGRESSAASWFNGLLDDFCILAYAADAILIRSIYESDAPVFAETSRYGFRATPWNLVKGDDEGFWVRDTFGNAVLGVYAGEAETKNWGGFNLAAGDILIGRNALGAAALRWTQATGKFGFYGGGNNTPQVEIGTDGSLYVGNPIGARVQMKGVELAGYDGSNQKQWYGSTADGRLYAGQGNVSLSRDGIRLKMDDVTENGWNELRWDAKTNGYGYFDIYAYTVVGSGNPRVRGVISAMPESSLDFAEIRLNAAGNGAAGGGRIILFGKVGVKTNNPQAALHVYGGILVEGDDGGAAGMLGLTNSTTAPVGAGAGAVKMNSATNRTSDAWIKVYINTTPYWIPAWSNIN